VFYNIRKKVSLGLFNFRTRNICHVAEVSIDRSAGFKILTQLQNSDVQMYLLALSSFCRYMKPREVIVVSDGLKEESTDLLKKCIEDVRIIPIEECRVEGLPSGGTWERLCRITTETESAYVIQLDADTLTTRHPDEVEKAIADNVCFTIVSNDDIGISSFQEASDLVANWQYKSVVVKAEQSLDKLRNPKQMYVRGCSAFTGFSPGSEYLDQLKSFSRDMVEVIGDTKWSEWGSEQVASNYLIANSKDCVLLPFDKYPFYSTEIEHDPKVVKFFHFIGSYRFKNGVYLSYARDLIDELSRGKN